MTEETTAVATEGEAKDAILMAVTEKNVQELLALANYAVLDIHNKTQVKEVHDRRMKLVRARRSIDEVRKERNAEYRKIIDDNNAKAKQLTELLAPAERKLEAEEERVEKALADEREAKAKAVYDDRRAKMATIEWDLSESAVRDMSDEVFDQTLIQMRAVYHERIRLKEEAAKAAAILAEQDRKDREERERQAAAEAEARRIAAQEEEDRRRRAEEELRRQREDLQRQQEELAAERRRLAEEQESARLSRQAFEAEMAAREREAEAKRLADAYAEAAKVREREAAEAVMKAAAEQAQKEPEPVVEALPPVAERPTTLFPEFEETTETVVEEPSPPVSAPADPEDLLVEQRTGVSLVPYGESMGNIEISGRFTLEPDVIDMLREDAIQHGYMNDALAVVLDTASPGEYVKLNSRWSRVSLHN